FLLEKPQYTLSYNQTTNTANWAAWQLDVSWLGSLDKSDHFDEDRDLPAGWNRVQGEPSFRAAGPYDRGHLAPDADRNRTTKDQDGTYLMTNILPQFSGLNGGTWKSLEDFSRDLVSEKGKSLYIFAGGYGSRGTISREGSNGPLEVNIPDHLWKVIV